MKETTTGGGMARYPIRKGIAQELDRSAVGRRRPPYSLSASPLSHAERPLGLALRRYSDFSAFVQRTWICSVARSLAGKGGLPRLGLSIPIFDYTKKFLTRAILSYILSTH
jgi:hypothetical protein